MKVGALVRRLALLFALALAPPALIVLAFVVYVSLGVLGGSRDATGILAGAGIRAPVRIDRDARGIPHIRAQNERDAFFAQGYLEGSDRLFQIDLVRRVVSGRAAEIFGPSALYFDENARVYDPVGLVGDEERRLPAKLRADLMAFAEGVNFAMRTRPLPPEFRILGYRPEPWTPRDSLLAATSTVLTLADRWYDVATRIRIARTFGPTVREAFYPITDPRYDAPIEGKPAAVPPLPSLKTIPFPNLPPLASADVQSERGEVGSNDFAAGAALTATHRALLANDPHLDLHMPGVWFLYDVAWPGAHVAGATLAGTPGVTLGHNAHVAWGATNGTIATTQLYRERFRETQGGVEYLAGNRWLRPSKRIETFRVRLGKTVTREYLATRHGFVLGAGPTRYAVAWTGERDRRSPFGTFYALAKARTVGEAFRTLATYPGPAQNFVLADDRGDAGYVLAGDVWFDESWGLAEREGATTPAATPVVPFAKLPQVAPSRRALVFSANNRTYGAGYRLRLTSNFEAPYRAARIAQLLRAKKNYTLADFWAIQFDVTSLAERDLAHATATALVRKGATQHDDRLAALAAALGSFDGRFAGESRAAVIASNLRIAASERLVRIHLGPSEGAAYWNGNVGEALAVLLRALRERPRGWVPHDDYDAFLTDAARDTLARMERFGRTGKTWAEIGARIARHPLATLGFTLWDGTRFPGFGDGFVPHVQGTGVTQSFRAVWDVGNWDAGGMVIPQGESGQPGSPHYRDGASSWIAGSLVPLPFSDSAVEKARVETLELRP